MYGFAKMISVQRLGRPEVLLTAIFDSKHTFTIIGISESPDLDTRTAPDWEPFFVAESRTFTITGITNTDLVVSIPIFPPLFE